MANLNYLFVYSGWLDQKRLKKELPNAQFITTGTCEDYCLQFADYQDDNGKEHQAGDLMEKVSGEMLYGAIWKIEEEELYHMDESLKLHSGEYRREYRAVMGQDGKPYAVTAFSVKHPVKKVKPRQDEAENLMAGANVFGFPEDYIKKIKTIC